MLSHPTQFEVPLFRYLASREPDLQLKAFYWNTGDCQKISDPELGHPPGWDFSLTDGYEWQVLPRDLTKFKSTVMAEILKDGMFDALIVNGYGAWQARVAMKEAFRAGMPVLLRSDTTLLYPRSFFKETVKRVLLRRLFSRIAGFLVTGSEARKYILRYGGREDRVFVFPYAVDNEALSRSCEAYRPQRAQIRRELGIGLDATVVLAVVKFVQREGGLDLIRAHEILATQHPDLVLLMVGDGVDAPSYRAYIESRKIPRVILPGYQPYSQLPKFYAIADVFVHPAHFEPWGVSVNEAMACGLSVIASDLVGASYDLVREKENGYVYPAGDIAALRAALESFLSRRADWHAMSTRSTDIIRSFDYAACASTLRNAIKSAHTRALAAGQPA